MKASRFSLAQLVAAALWHHRRVYASVMLGVAVGTAVLSGALIVGESVRESLRRLTLERLGQVSEVLQATRYFRARWAQEVASLPHVQAHYRQVLPAMLVQGTVQAAPSKRLSSRVQLLGVVPEFWSVGKVPEPVKHPGPSQVVLNAPLAQALGVQVGEEVLVRVRRITWIPEETPFGRKEEAVESLRLEVCQVIPARGLGRFGLFPNQQLPQNAYLDLKVLQQLVRQPGRANSLLFVSLGAAEEPTAKPAVERLRALLRPRLEDYGLRVRQSARGYFQLSSNRLLLEPAVEAAAMKAWQDLNPQGVLTYLANWISVRGGKARVPYSTVSALDFSDTPPLGPWRDVQGRKLRSLGPGEIVLNSWTWEDLNRQLRAQGEKPLQPGEPVELTYFVPQYATAGSQAEKTVRLRLAAVVPLEQGSPALDPQLTPEVPGLTDKESLEDWDPPFEFYQSRVRPEDEQYWDRYRATPKAFVSLATGQRLWGTKRFGQLTAIHVPPHKGLTVSDLAQRLENHLQPRRLGFELLEVKRQGLAASAGTTPFAQLFLSFSFFLILAAALLVMLLFRLGVEQRVRQVGLMLAVGFTPSRARAVLLAEGLAVAALGAAVGLALGAGFAWLMLFGLRTWWLGAVGTPFLNFHASWKSFAVGYVSGVVLSGLAVYWGLWMLRGLSVRALLAGKTQPGLATRPARRWPWMAGAVGLFLLGGGLSLWGLQLAGERQAPAFFGAGACVLLGGVVLVRLALAQGTQGRLVRGGLWPLAHLAWGNTARHPVRSSWTVALMAAATFMIAGVNAFRLDPVNRPPRKDSGDGGLALVAQSLPIYRNLGDPEVLDQLAPLSDQQRQVLQGVRIYSFRLLPGEDASCRNLYQTSRPQVLGVPEEFIRRGGFAWYASLAQTPEEKRNPWLLLQKDWGQDAQGRPRVPVVLDMNTAMFSLHLYQVGAEFVIQDRRGMQVPLVVVGMLQNSIFQGAVLMSQEQFQRHFPYITGFQFFAIEAPWEHVAEVEQVLEESLSDLGFDVQRTS